MYLSLGFMGGLVQRKFDMSKVTTNSHFDGNSYDSNLATGENMAAPSYAHFDGTVGMSFNTPMGEDPENNFFAGIAYHHFNKAGNSSFYDNAKMTITPHWVYSAGVKMATTDNSYLTIHADLSKQGVYNELVAGALLTYRLEDAEFPKYYIHGGAFLRWNDAVIPVVKPEMKPLATGESYDINVSKLSVAKCWKGVVLKWLYRTKNI